MRTFTHETVNGKTLYLITETITQNILIRCADNTFDLNKYGHLFKIVWDIIKVNKGLDIIDITTYKNWGDGITFEHDVSWATCESQPMLLPISNEQLYEWYHKLNHAIVNSEIKFVPYNQPRHGMQELK